jgi:hypothetical protein
MVSTQLERLENDSDKLSQYVLELKNKGDHALAQRVEEKLIFLRRRIEEIVKIG